MSSNCTVQKATTHAYTVRYARHTRHLLIIIILTYCLTVKISFLRTCIPIVRIEVYVTALQNEKKKGKRQSKGARLITFKSSKRRLQPLLMQQQLK